MKMFGIPNCDTIKKARKFLDTHHINYEFHDYKQQGIDLGTLQQWLESIDLSLIVNKRSTTWRQLSESQKTELLEQSNLQILVDHPTLIKRPVLLTDSEILVGFSESDYQNLV